MDGDTMEVTGPKGTLRRSIPPGISVVVEGERALVRRSSDAKTMRALHGTTRAHLQNMVVGVTAGFEKFLEIEGVGYRVRPEKSGIVLELGYSHPILFMPPEGVSLTVLSPTQIRVFGIDKELVGITAAKIRSFRPPEVYTGKGIRCRGEVVRRKPGKAGGRA